MTRPDMIASSYEADFGPEHPPNPRPVIRGSLRMDGAEIAKWYAYRDIQNELGCTLRMAVKEYYRRMNDE